MRLKIILSLLLFVFAFFACQDKDLSNEEKRILKEWVPFFRQHENLSGIKVGERLAYSYQESLSRVAGKKVKVYPPYLGGWYICQEDTSKMVITLTDTNQIIKDQLIRMCSLEPEKIIFKLCDFSINEMSELQIQLAYNHGFYEKWNVASIGHDYKKNRLIVMFETVYRDEDLIKLFKSEVSDSPMLDFWFPSDDLNQEQDSLIIPEAKNNIEPCVAISSYSLGRYGYVHYNAQVGDAIYALREPYDYTGSIGFLVDPNRGWPEEIKFSMKCFVTAAHMFEKPDEDLYWRPKKGNYDDFYLFGKQYKLNRDLDVALCSASDEFFTILAAYKPVPCFPSLGDRVKVRGCVLDGYFSGEVVLLGDLHIIEENNISCSVIKMDNNKKVLSGNSGGIVLTSDDQVAGMLVGSNKNAPWVAYFVPALEITTLLGETIVSNYP